MALDHRCEVFAVAKWVGVKTKEIKAKLGTPEHLPCVDEVKKMIAKDMSERLIQLKEDQQTAIDARLTLIESHRMQMLERHKQERQILKEKQDLRQAQEIKRRQALYRNGLRGLFDRLTGKHSKIKKQNELEALLANQRDSKEKDQMIFKQLEQSRKLQQRVGRLQSFRISKKQDLNTDLKQYSNIDKQKASKYEFTKNSLDRKSLPTRDR